MTIFYLALAIVSGLCMSLQSPTNATLSRHVGNLQATTISFGGGAVCLAVLALIIGTGDLSLISEASWWMFLGGVYGAAIVFINLVSIPHLGSAFLLIAITLGQLTGGMLVDSFGLLRTAKIKMNSWRYTGMAVIAIGVIIVAMTKM